MTQRRRRTVREGDLLIAQLGEKVRQRFLAKIAPAGLFECWLWIGTPGQRYGLLWCGEPLRFRQAHRAAFVWTRGVPPEAFDLDHLCRQRMCVNPLHLDPVPHVENVHRGDVPILTFEIAQQIRQLHAAGARPKELAHRFGTVESNIRWIVIGRTWKAKAA